MPESNQSATTPNRDELFMQLLAQAVGMFDNTPETWEILLREAEQNLAFYCRDAALGASGYPSVQSQEFVEYVVREQLRIDLLSQFLSKLIQSQHQQ